MMMEKLCQKMRFQCAVNWFIALTTSAIDDSVGGKRVDKEKVSIAISGSSSLLLLKSISIRLPLSPSPVDFDFHLDWKVIESDKRQCRAHDEIAIAGDSGTEKKLIESLSGLETLFSALCGLKNAHNFYRDESLIELKHTHMWFRLTHGNMIDCILATARQAELNYSEVSGKLIKSSFFVFHSLFINFT
jgi:hypothetical protein